MRPGIITCLVTFVLGGVLSMLQLWFGLLPTPFFVKAMVTLSIVFVVTLGVTLVRREFLEDQKLRQSGYID